MRGSGNKGGRGESVVYVLTCQEPHLAGVPFLQGSEIFRVALSAKGVLAPLGRGASDASPRVS